MTKTMDFIFLEDENQSFIIRSLKDSLLHCGYEADRHDIHIRELEKLEQMPKFFIVDAELLLKYPDARVYLYDRCIESNRKVIPIGYRNTLQSLFDVSITNVIAASFERPMNNNEVTEKLSSLVRSFDAKGAERTILVVDDSPAFLRLMSEWLEKDYNVNVCPSVSAAFHMIETNRPDLILLDYEMPICNGAQFLEMLHSEPATAKIPVMFLTSKDDAQTVKSLIALKPQGYLLKNQPKDYTLRVIAELFIREQMK